VRLEPLQQVVDLILECELGEHANSAGLLEPFFQRCQVEWRRFRCRWWRGLGRRRCRGLGRRHRLGSGSSNSTVFIGRLCRSRRRAWHARDRRLWLGGGSRRNSRRRDRAGLLLACDCGLLPGWLGHCVGRWRLLRPSAACRQQQEYQPADTRHDRHGVCHCPLTRHPLDRRHQRPARVTVFNFLLQNSYCAAPHMGHQCKSAGSSVSPQACQRARNSFQCGPGELPSVARTRSHCERSCASVSTPRMS
jgi:hypothetical protein